MSRCLHSTAVSPRPNRMGGRVYNRPMADGALSIQAGVEDELRLLRASVREFVAREVAPHMDEWERAGELPRALHEKAGAAGLRPPGSDAATPPGPRIAFHDGASRPAAVRMGCQPENLR